MNKAYAVKGKDQTSARDFNMKVILQLLSEEELSCSELAKKIGLSKPAMTKITSEMFELNLIRQGSRSSSGAVSPGRKRVYLAVNPDFGLIAAVDFSTVEVKIRLCDMNSRTVGQRLVPHSETVTPETLEAVAKALEEMLACGGIEGRELFSLCIAASGMVDKQTGELVVSPKFRPCAGIDIRNYFQARFGCWTAVKNDVNLALLGEQQYGCIQNTSDAFMLYLDAGLGGALLVDNRIAEGSRGFAGEFGQIEVNTPEGCAALETLLSIGAITEAARRKGVLGKVPAEFHFEELVEAYRNAVPEAVETVEARAEILSSVIRNLSAILDSASAVIGGRVRLLGDAFLQSLRSKVPGARIEYSGLEDDGVICGAIYAAKKMAIDVVIERRR